MQTYLEGQQEDGHLIATAGPAAAEPPSGKTDLLLRFFDSQFFDEWVCLTYLYKSTSAGVQDYLCNRLYSLPESGVELYLLQLVHLVLSRPHSPLERVLVDLCARSLRLAVKVFWLVLAHTQDHPGNRYAVEFRDACERAAVEGYWEPPFKDARLMPLSPTRSNMFTPPMSPLSSIVDSFSPRSINNPRPRRRRNSADGYLAEASGRCLSPMQPRTPDYGGGGPSSGFQSGQVMGLEGLMYGSPTYLSPVRPSNRGDQGLNQGDQSRVAGLRVELGNGEGVSTLLSASLRDSGGGGSGVVHEPELLSPPSSPRQRSHTFGATLDFIEALCLASSGLAAFPHDDRQWALVRALEDISSAIEAASRSGIAIWSPLGTSDERIVRLAARESRLLASRERTPFVLYIEVLQADAAPQATAPAPTSANSTSDTDFRPQPSAAPATALQHHYPATAELSEQRGQVGNDRPEQHPGLQHTGNLVSDQSKTVSQQAPDDQAAQSLKGGQQDSGDIKRPPKHFRTVSAAEEAGGSGEDPFRNVHLPAGDQSSGRVHNRSLSTVLPSPTSPPPADWSANRRTLSHTDVLQLLRPPDPKTKTALDINRLVSNKERTDPQDAADVKVRSERAQQSPRTSISQSAVAAWGASPFAAAATAAAEADATANALPTRPNNSSSSSSSSSRSSSMNTRRTRSSSNSDSYHHGVNGGPYGTEVPEDADGDRSYPLPSSQAKSSFSAAPAALVVDRPLPVSSPEELLSPHQRQRRMLRERSLQMRQPSQQMKVSSPEPRRHRQPGDQSSEADKAALSPQPHPRQLPRREPATECATFRAAPDPVLTTGLSVAMEALRGDGPQVRLQLRVLNDMPASHPSTIGAPSAASSATARRYSDSDASGSPRDQMPGSSHSQPKTSNRSDLPRPPQTSPPAAEKDHPLNSGLFCKLGMCRQCNAKAQAAKAASAAAAAAPRVHVQLQVTGGVDLRLGTSPSSAGVRRIPSSEALSLVATSHQMLALGPDLKQQALVRQQMSAASQRGGWRSRAATMPVRGAPLRANSSLSAATTSVEAAAAAAVADSTASAAGGANLAGAPGHLISPSPNSKTRQRTAGLLANGGPSMSLENVLAVPLDKGSPLLQLPGRRKTEGSRPEAEGTSSAQARSPQLTAVQRADRRAAAASIYGERFQDRAARVKALSPHGRRPGWALRPVIVKSGDDCRQEALAMQLIATFDSLFHEERLPLWLRPYEVLVTSDRTALIEFVPNTASIHALKSKSSPGSTLRDHYLACFGPVGTPEWAAAQRAFVESMAAYSIVSYLLQIKDRHNGNILVDEAGHLVHIDFGFMLSNSPGGVNFEAAPFKLTRELLQIMDSDSDGRASQLFDYFKVLCIRGFLAARKHADRILLLVEMMEGSAFPCFKAGSRTVPALRRRFAQHLTEPQVVDHVLGLIGESLDSWRTRQYDIYQRLLNGIA